MKHIAKNAITNIVADNANPGFPPINLLDDKPKRVWRAGEGVSDTTLYFDIGGTTTDIAIFGTNAYLLTFDVIDPNFMEWGDSDTWGDDDTWANSVIAPITGTIYNRDLSGAFWIDLGLTVTVPCEVSVHLYATLGQELYAGIVTGGVGETYGSPGIEYGLREDREDRSIISELSNGARYYKKRDITRVFDGMFVCLASEFHRFSRQFDLQGAIPSAWRLEDLDTEMIVYGYPEISATYSYYVHTEVHLKINEVI